MPLLSTSISSLSSLLFSLLIPFFLLTFFHYSSFFLHAFSLLSSFLHYSFLFLHLFFFSSSFLFFPSISTLSFLFSFLFLSAIFWSFLVLTQIHSNSHHISYYHINHIILIISNHSHHITSNHFPHTISFIPFSYHPLPAPVTPYHIISSHLLSFLFDSYVLYRICHTISSNLISFHPILSYHIYISYMSPHLIKSYLLCFCFCYCSTDYSIQSVCFD